MVQIEQLLRSAIGLEASSVGPALIERTVRQRMQLLGVPTTTDYVGLLESSPQEWRELVEAVVVAETWFFRDDEPFKVFASLVLNEWLPAHPGEQLRLLSVPCSSGEEPYSIVMALLDAGVPGKSLYLDAVDLSARALERAQRGVYGANSFRSKDLQFRDRHFTKSPDGYALNPRVQRHVHFHQANLLSDDFLRIGTAYHFVFCRNLLIYFDADAQKRSLERLKELLMPSGILFLGAAEMPLAVNHGFAPANYSMAFACRKAAPARKSALSQARPHFIRPQKKSLPPVLKVNYAGPAVVTSAKAAQQGPAKAADNSETADLDTAWRLADAGRLKDAARICEANLRRHGASARAYYLLGLVLDAGGNVEAESCYRKALYLEPNHRETLLQMALFFERRGDVDQARRFKNRDQRCLPKNNSL